MLEVPEKRQLHAVGAILSQLPIRRWLTAAVFFFWSPVDHGPLSEAVARQLRPSACKDNLCIFRQLLSPFEKSRASAVATLGRMVAGRADNFGNQVGEAKPAGVRTGLAKGMILEAMARDATRSGYLMSDANSAERSGGRDRRTDKVVENCRSSGGASPLLLFYGLSLLPLPVGQWIAPNSVSIGTNFDRPKPRRANFSQIGRRKARGSQDLESALELWKKRLETNSCDFAGGLIAGRKKSSSRDRRWNRRLQMP